MQGAVAAATIVELAVAVALMDWVGRIRLKVLGYWV